MRRGYPLEEAGGYDSNQRDLGARKPCKENSAKVGMMMIGSQKSGLGVIGILQRTVDGLKGIGL